MAPISMTLSDLECHSSMDMTCVNYVVCIHEWASICGLYSQLFSKNERLFKVTPLYM